MHLFTTEDAEDTEVNLIHFCTRMNKIHLCFLRVLCGEQMHNRKTITLYAASHTPMADNRHTS